MLGCAIGRDLRKETQERLAAALARAREARGNQHHAVDASTAAWAILALGDAAIVRGRTTETARIVDIVAFAEGDAGGRVRA